MVLLLRRGGASVNSSGCCGCALLRRRVVLRRPVQRIHHRQRRARRSWRLLGRGDRARVDGDGDLDRAAEFLRERVDDQRPELGLQVLLHERVGGGDQRRVLHEAERPVSRSQASWLAGSPISASPSRDRAHTSARSTSLTDGSPRLAVLTRAATGSTRRSLNRNSLSTGSSTRCVRALQCGFPIPSLQPAPGVAICGS